MEQAYGLSAELKRATEAEGWLVAGWPPKPGVAQGAAAMLGWAWIRVRGSQAWARLRTEYAQATSRQWWCRTTGALGLGEVPVAMAFHAGRSQPELRDRYLQPGRSGVDAREVH